MSKRHESSTSPIFFTLQFAFFCVFAAVVSSILIYLTIYFFKTAEAAKKAELSVLTDISAQPRTVVIDAGHGGEDGGTSGKNGPVEKDINLEIAFALRDMLRAAGIPTVMTRTEDILLYDKSSDYAGHKKSQDLRTRLETAKAIPGSVLVSIHMNSFPDEKYKGLQVWYSANTVDSKLLADSVQALSKEKLQPYNNRATKCADSSLYLLHRANSTAILAECGFLSNPEESELLSQDEYRKKIALILCEAVIRLENVEK